MSNVCAYVTLIERLSIAFTASQAEICDLPKVKETCLNLVHFLPVSYRYRASSKKRGALNLEEENFHAFGEQRWRSGESTRLPPMWPGFDSQTRRHMWAEFVGSLLCTERFSPGTPVSPLLKKPTFDLSCVNC